MKAERRQELKANALLWHIQGLPEQIKKYQSQIALVIVLIALAFVLIRYRMNAAEQRFYDAQTAMGVAAEDFTRLQNLAGGGATDLDNLMKAREEAYSDGLQQADTVFQKAPDSQPGLKARALRMKGDLNFEMANMPELPGSATQPSLRPAESTDTLLNAAADAYTQILNSYPDEKFAVVAAHFGLAAVNENRGAWDDAKAQYQAVIDSDAEQGYKDLAKERIALIPQISQPVTIDLQAATKPSFVPAILGPATQPMIAGPTTRK